ncbi:MAG: hypothetical protein A2508_05035 [Candidatus Lambdaproteobacteria bacterium RIFOXYD12_FULL_49_8]|uniref:Blue (type 1) copper domain-containing protein n=1 Tax=Candidatus Lambdaproteobacteria bacterium RIFOXYD2_FULL_50_16 TaxID=1817772 RepID=A0A1F6GB32_9PROT|nr:MAG: hypothetical protein A2527_07345 [Candidatus Lambdaproteobacteria bacterium RIFOXYD2_FULL_50_16]OGG96206.1 MAG: hypothetical protein A2508_05035 [Candidatus Lambdaproteobacteria bacterium RIFOXYD12_FULL_49_8]
MKWIGIGVALISLSGMALAADTFQVAQKDIKFSVEYLVVHQGDKVEFPNLDTVHHNVFSLSETKTFDLGSYKQGQSRAVVFDKPGMVKVECAIHPSMKMIIEVR